jgi:16S rRNA (guanine966-N2)-methyltransferase
VTRIVAGRAKGRRLAVPAEGTRPTSDRAREALFSALESALLARGGMAGARFLDLYAGSGAVGLEALSRGAAEVLLVESDRGAAQVLRRNVDVVDLDGATVQVAAVEQLARSTAGTRYDVVFLDPPYALADADVAEVLTSLARRHWLAADALVVVERPSRAPEFAWPEGFEGLRSRRYGEATMWFGRFGTVAAC